MSDDFDMAEIIKLFVEESVEGLDIMEQGLLNLDFGACDLEVMNSIFRAAHSIKGGGGMFGFTEIAEFTHHVETLLDEMRQGDRAVTEGAVTLLLESVDCIRGMLDSLEENGEVDAERTASAAELTAKLKEMLANEAPVESVADVLADTVAEPLSTGWKIYFKPKPEMLRDRCDPLPMFEELSRLGDLEVRCDGVAQLNFASMDPEECALSWELTLSGDTTAAKIDEILGWVEDDCDCTVEAIDQPVLAENASEPDPPAESSSKPGAPAKVAEKRKSTVRSSGSIRVNIDKIDDLINLVGELVITQSMLGRFGRKCEPSDQGDLRDSIEQLSRNTRELQESVMAIRMLPISTSFSRFPRLVHDLSSKLDKKVELVLSGENTELDKTVLEKIGDPLVHLVRNSLDHGIETPDVRVAAGKPETGILELKAYHQGGNIIIEVIDDGAGINQERVLSIARSRGIVGVDEVLSHERINNLIFQAGFSTAETVSDVSGRGVGMDVVRRNINDLGGIVSLESEEGKGSKITIRLPLTLAILDGQLVQVGDEVFIFPLVSIIETVQISADTVNTVAGESELFKLRDEYIPVMRLCELFGVASGKSVLKDGLLVVVEADNKRAGIFVDDLLEQQQVVIKSLESNFRQVEGLAGATILGDGTVALIIDVPGLVSLADKRGSTTEPVVAVA